MSFLFALNAISAIVLSFSFSIHNMKEIMTMITKKMMLPALASLVLTSLSLFSDENPDEVVIQDHVQVGSREMDDADRDMIDLQRAEEHEDAMGNTEGQQTLRRISNKLKEAESAPRFSLAPAKMLKAQLTPVAYAWNCHTLAGYDNRYLGMEDGSKWEYSPSDAYTIRFWGLGQVLVVSPNYSWFSSFDYYITNQNTGTYVTANLFDGPVAHGPFSHWIASIDYVGGHVYLENQMVWCVNPSDMSIMQKWKPNDHIILGIYDSWFSSYDTILINVDMDDHVRAIKY